MPTPISILMVIVSLAVFVMLGINVFLMLQNRRRQDQPDEKYLFSPRRFDALATIVNDQLQKGREATDRATLSVSTLISDQLEKNRQTSERARLTVHQQVQSFTQNMTQLQEGMKQMNDSVKN